MKIDLVVISKLTKGHAFEGYSMFFFIAGIQPKHIELESLPRRCPSCGLYQAYLKRMDYYFSAFFLPLFRVKKGANFIECRRCGVSTPESEESVIGLQKGIPNPCPYCGVTVDPVFRYCPSCGKALKNG